MAERFGSSETDMATSMEVASSSAPSSFNPAISERLEAHRRAQQESSSKMAKVFDILERTKNNLREFEKHRLYQMEGLKSLRARLFRENEVLRMTAAELIDRSTSAKANTTVSVLPKKPQSVEMAPMVSTTSCPRWRTSSKSVTIAKTPSKTLSLVTSIAKTPSKTLSLATSLAKTPSKTLSLATSIARTPSKTLSLATSIPRTPSRTSSLATSMATRRTSSNRSLNLAAGTPSQSLSLPGRSMARTPSKSLSVAVSVAPPPKTSSSRSLYKRKQQREKQNKRSKLRILAVNQDSLSRISGESEQSANAKNLKQRFLSNFKY